MNGKYLTLIGAALTLALTSNVAVAESAKFLIGQSSGGSSSGSSGEIKLSPRVNKKKFCNDYPLNSRCQEGSASTSSPSDSSTETKKKPSKSTPGGTATPGLAPADPGTTNTPGGTNEIAPPPAGNPANPGTTTPSGSPGSGTRK
ncbi:hypothetical protein [Brasilonema bromeliae]|uniref:Uncharacterized protein n=1 Tax=Brasilonema bromeliae SPC951 TaxID=385972 RepID=A0ABX1P225_9CYAN|nr:hypothetical protein [Brasilonema bromeliae]NMG18078.1 hypothetical protein [Brasilonema bromeliae SPC951]